MAMLLFEAVPPAYLAHHSNKTKKSLSWTQLFLCAHLPESLQMPRRGHVKSPEDRSAAVPTQALQGPGVVVVVI